MTLSWPTRETASATALPQLAAVLVPLLCWCACDSSSDTHDGMPNGGGGAGASTTASGGAGGAGGVAGGTAAGGAGGVAPPGELIWKLDAGDLEKTEYDALVATMPLGPSGRPQPDTNNYRIALPTAPQFFTFGIHYEVPTLEPDLRVRTVVPVDAHNTHNAFRMRNTDKLIEGAYTKMQQAYKVEFEADFSSASSWQDIGWCIFFQIWGAHYPNAWGPPQHPINPPIALSLDSAEFEIRVYGEHEPDLDMLTNNSAWTHSDTANWPYTPGPHFFEVWVTSDYRLPSAGGIGAIRVAMDGATVYENLAVVNAINSQIDGQDSGGYPSFGAYSYEKLPAPTYPDIIFDRVKLYEL